MSGILFDRAGSSPDPPWRTIGELVGEAAERFTDREFLRFPRASLTFAGAHAASNRLAHVLIAHGVRPGDRVAIMMGNVPDWPLSWFAIGKAGAIAVPVNARYRDADLGFVLADSAAVMVLTAAEQADLVRAVAAVTGTVREVLTPAELAGELAEARATDPAVPLEPTSIVNFQYTSGTTGFPKACMLSHDYWLRTGWLTAIEAELRAGDVMLMAQAFSYMDPQWASVMCLMGGCPLVVLPRFSASGFWTSVRDHHATLTYVLGAMPMLMFAQPASPLDRDHRMRLVLCSGIVPDLHQRFEERWGVPWRELYGTTESGLDLAVPPGAAQTIGTGAMGKPPPGKQVRIADEADRTRPDGEVGQILIHGAPMMTGYWNHPDSTGRAFRGGWYHTGDLGFRDAEGWIHHAGRLKDMIRRGGENISAVEVEHVLALHPAVAAAALVPIPDEMFGELPKAFIQLAPGHQPSTQTAVSVLDHARGKLAGFKVPAYLEFVETFPMTPSARIEKGKLLERDRDQRIGVFDVAANTWASRRRDDMAAWGTESGYIEVAVQNAVAVVTLRRPDRLNALTAGMRRELAAILRHFGGGGEQVRGVVVTGTGRAFSAGLDLREAAELPPGGLVADVELFHDITRAALQTRVPVVGALNGIAVGGACEMTLCFDARIGTPATEFFLPENSLGLTISNASSVLLPRLAGHHAMRLVMESARIAARDGLALGLLDEIVEQADLVQTAIGLVHRWTRPGAATAAHLRLLRPSLTVIEQAMAAETEAASGPEAAAIAAEGINRFLSRREAGP